MRVLRVVTLASRSGRYGGPFDTALRQVGITNKAGYISTLLAGVTVGDEPLPLPGKEPVVEYIVVSAKLPNIGFATHFSWRLVRRLRIGVRDADLVHVSAARELIPLLTMLFALVYRKPYIVQPHGMLTSRSSLVHRILDLIVRPLVKRGSGIIALTNVELLELQRWLRNNSSKMFVLGNPVPEEVETLERHRPLRNEALFIARLHPRKRVDVFIDAARYAHSRGWKELYTVAGPNEGDIALVQKAVMEIPGFAYEGTLTASEVTARVQNTGIFVLPSLNEPWGNVLATAIAGGVPVVVAESAALASFIADFGAGSLSEDGDGEALANSVHHLLEDMEKYRASSRGAVAMADAMLSQEVQARTLANIYINSTAMDS